MKGLIEELLTFIVEAIIIIIIIAAAREVIEMVAQV